MCVYVSVLDGAWWYCLISILERINMQPEPVDGNVGGILQR